MEGLNPDQIDDKPTCSSAALSLNQRLPAFWPSRPDLWFIQFEAVTHASRLSDPDKARLVIAQLGQNELLIISDLFNTVTPQTPVSYETLKKRLITSLSDSTFARTQKLLGQFDFPDTRPSAMLRHLRDTATNTTFTDDIIRHIWIQNLPIHIRAVCAAQSTDLDTLALMADSIQAQTQPAHIAATQEHNSLQQQVGQLTKMLERVLQTGPRRNFTSRLADPHRNYSPGRRRSRSPSPKYVSSPNKIRSTCYFHRKFGNAARNCRPPCNYHPEN